jgi:hypothetical protein
LREGFTVGDDADKAKFYRERAKRVRETASTLSSFDTRDGLLLVASSYETIAESLERIEETRRVLGLLKD